MPSDNFTITGARAARPGIQATTKIETVDYQPRGAERIKTGLPGLDAILRGGLVGNRLYLLEGSPGSGKTTAALQFLLEGVAAGERVLYITLSETTEELRVVADSHGWTLDGMNVFELSSAEAVRGETREQTVLHPWEVELGETIQLITDEVERIEPVRVVFDSLSELRLLAQDSLRYRRQILALKQFLAGRKTTVIMVDDLSGGERGGDTHLHSICHGVITLQRQTLNFGGSRRRLQVQKLRGVEFIGGWHDFVIRRGGLDIFPRLIATGSHAAFVGDPLPSNVPELDALLGGGPLRGTTTLFTGPAGSGKTTVALQYIGAACVRNERAIIFEFDERIGTMLTRAKALGMDLQPYIDKDLLVIRQVDPAEISPGELAWTLRREVEQRDARLVMIDSLSGYVSAMPQEQQLILQMHEMLSYMNQRGVVTFLINPQAGLMGSMQTSGINVSYVADAVVLFRFFEAGGRIRKAISVVKNRGGQHEDTIRELRIDPQGVRVGEPLTNFKGVLSGTPEYTGERTPLLEDRTNVG